MSKQSKSNPEKGLRTVSIEFGGKQRTLKFGHTSIGDFEAEASQVLRMQKVIEPGQMVFADGLVRTWLGNAKIFSIALKYGLVDDAKNDPDNAIKDIGAAIDEYIESGKAKHDLTRAVITAYNYATNPSFVASLKRSWQISDDREKFNTAEEVEAMERMEKIIADAKAKVTLGLPSNDLPS
jgi:hypothetical protein